MSENGNPAASNGAVIRLDDLGKATRVDPLVAIRAE